MSTKIQFFNSQVFGISAKITGPDGQQKIVGVGYKSYDYKDLKKMLDDTVKLMNPKRSKKVPSYQDMANEMRMPDKKE